MTPRLAVITDETGPRLDDCLEFAVSEGLQAIEVRQVDGINPLSLTPAQIDSASRRISASGLSVAGIATPLFKWPAPGHTVKEFGDQFGFDRAGRSDQQLFEDAIRVSDAFGTGSLRIFSFLAHDGFKLDDLKASYDALLTLAEKHDKVLLVENEFVCNIARMDQLAELMAFYDSDRLKPLPDIANSAQVGETPSQETIAALISRCDHLHFKDYSASNGGFVTLGDGDVNVIGYVADVLKFAGERQLTFSLETHANSGKLDATRKSLNYLRSVLADYSG